jgi:hypothetical protein
MTFEIIDTDTQNTLDSFDNEDDARRAVQEMLGRDDSRLETLALVAFDERGEAVQLTPAAALVELV